MEVALASLLFAMDGRTPGRPLALGTPERRLEDVVRRSMLAFVSRFCDATLVFLLWYRDDEVKATLTISKSGTHLKLGQF